MLGLVAAYLLGRSDGRREDEHDAFDPDLLPTPAEQAAWRVVLPLALVLGIVVAVAYS